MSVYVQRSASIQPRTSRKKMYDVTRYIYVLFRDQRASFAVVRLPVGGAGASSAIPTTSQAPLDQSSSQIYYTRFPPQIIIGYQRNIQ